MTTEYSDIFRIVSRNQKKYDADNGWFKKVFNRDIDDFFDMILGFDAIKFDEEIAMPINDYGDGETCESTLQATYRRYGDQGIRVIYGLTMNWREDKSCGELLRELHNFKYPSGFEHLKRKE